jgi:hypothetical protein
MVGSVPHRGPLLLLLALTTVTTLSACGGGGTEQVEKKSPTTTTKANAKPSPEEDASAAAMVAQNYTDDDDCSLMSDRYAADGFSSPEEGRQACNDDTDPGLRAGEYRVSGSSVSGDRATVKFDVNTGGTRTLTLTRGGREGWQIDNVEVSQRGKVGDTFTLYDSYEQNGTPVDVNLRITVLSVRSHVQGPPYYPIKSNERWVRARIRIKSRTKQTFSQSTDDFKLIDATGQRYSSDGGAFQPSLGNGGVSLSKGETVVGYLGFKVLKTAKVQAIRIAPLSGGDPLQWRVG